jgi:hypothetical protein
LVLHPRRTALAVRTVRLDEETEKILAQIVTLTGLSVSAAVKKGLRARADDIVGEARHVPYEIYKALDLGPGGHAIAPASEVRRGVRTAIRRKLHR